MEKGDKIKFVSHVGIQMDEAPGVVEEMYQFMGGVEVTFDHINKWGYVVIEEDPLYVYSIHWIEEDK